MPEGWACEPDSQTLRFVRENERKSAPFVVTPPARLGGGDATIRAVVAAGAREYRRGYRAIRYHHIETRHVDRFARGEARFFETVTRFTVRCKCSNRMPQCMVI